MNQEQTDGQIPVLAINGSMDLQVLPEQNLGAIDQALRKAGNTRYTIREFPGLNHFFQTAKTGLMDECGSIQETISPAVLEFICSWIISLATP
ncbi:MAG: hypothetical protein EHM28_00585 [Spirochaetaceae bacterium]|nr:MAG: hypothetical protein EHM28_00585 [Spirochaetaceae bacterium]